MTTDTGAALEPRPSDPADLSDDDIRSVFEKMIASRVFEEGLGEEFARQRAFAKQAIGGRNSAFEPFNAPHRIAIQGNIELSIGQEATPAAVCHWLRDEDYAAGTHRSHSLALSKGVPARKILAEIYGKRTGLCGGRAGDFMLNDTEVNFENSAIMAQLTGPALGFAFASLRQGREAVSTVFIGDGASNQGIVHEAMNLASLWRLPVLFVIENNGYAISTPAARSSAIGDYTKRADAYGFPSAEVVDSDLERLVITAGGFIARARRGEGPALLVSNTNRLKGAFEGDNQAYRAPEELAEARRRDALPLIERRLTESGRIDRAWLDGVYEREREAFAAALRYAETSEFPTPESALEGLFA